jgi:hypothetical protein
MLGTERRDVFLASMAVFLCLNFVENLFHYSIGRHAQDEPPNDPWAVPFNFPTSKDLLRIVFIMIVFALLQGFLTCLFVPCLSK